MDYKNLTRGDRISFTCTDEFTGELMDRDGIVLGGKERVIKMWPEEMGHLTDFCYLVKVEDAQDQTFHYAVYPEQVLAVKDHIKI